MLTDYYIHSLTNNKYFISRQQFPYNLFIKRYNILTTTILRNKTLKDYIQLRIELMSLHGIEHVRSDEDPYKSLSDEKREQYLFETNLFKKTKDISCEKCGLYNHFESQCTEEFDIIGNYIGDYKGSDDEEYIDQEEQEEQEDQDYKF
jgi:hypothetical protein